MNEEEASLRKELRRMRGLATSLQRSLMFYDLTFRRFPQLQAEAIINGWNYELSARLLARVLIASDELVPQDQVCPRCGEVIPWADVLNERVVWAKRKFQEQYGPLEVIQEVTMPMVKLLLEATEWTMVEQGYRLPKWRRPRWLVEMEKGERHRQH